MKFEVDPSTIVSAARILRDQPELSNAALLQRLAVVAGPQILQQVPVTHCQRRVRDPAMKLVRDWMANGGEPGGPGPKGEPSEAAPGSETAPESERPRGRRRGEAIRNEATGGDRGAPRKGSAHRSQDPRADSAGRGRDEASAGAPARRASERMLRTVDEALVEAYALGADADSSTQVVSRFRELEELRRQVRKALGARS